MARYKNLLPIFFIFVLAACSSNHSLIKDIIKPVNLIAGKTDSMLVSDMFYSENYDIEFIPNKKVSVTYNKSNGMIYFKPDMNFSGTTLLDFAHEGNVYSVPVKSRVQQKYKFSYKPDQNYKVLTLFGSFNGWDRGNLPMKDDDGDGVFETKIPLEPGRYEYKFFGDGKEIVDPHNPDKKPNGMGDFNSVFVVPGSKTGKHFLHNSKFDDANGKSIFAFVYETEDNEPLKFENVIALLDNSPVPEKNILINSTEVKIIFDKDELKEKSQLRVTVNKNGKASNLQSVFLVDGNPAGRAQEFLWNDAVIYSLLIDRFSDGDQTSNKKVVHDSLLAKANYMGGDFQGIINKLNEGYFDSLGVNTIWLSPVYDNPNSAYRESPEPHRWYSGYHGYWPVNSFDTEEKFGTLDKLKELVNTAHKRGIKILLDVVANHVHEQHPLFKEHPEWFGSLTLPDGRRNLRLWDEQRLTTWFEPYLPKFNYVGSQDAIDFMSGNAIWWLNETGADGFRQDAVKHITNQFWRSLTKRLKNEIEIPNSKKVYQIGETFGSYELINSYVNNGQLSAQFNFNVYDVALPTFLDSKIPFSVLDAELKKSFLVYGENNLMGNIMDSHDKNRFMAFADGDLDVSQWSAGEIGWNNPPGVDNPANYAKAKLYYAYMNSIPGLPVIYYGSEFGMSGASDPDNRRMMRFGNELNKDEKKMFDDVRQIINTRKNHSALRYGDFLTLRADENIYAFVRSDFNERILIVMNKNEAKQSVELLLPQIYNCKSVTDLMNGEELKVESGKLKAVVEGVGYKFFMIK
ncbi:MAG: alpha-glucosidase C-terminal domain-containing protein [Ignavibacteriales bacterium]|nr:alpha-glucosidase C-terminal domain-containing protein [Ignavibacteriales bacterium]